MKKRKEEKEEERKEMRSWSTLQQGRFFSYLGDPWSRGFSMAMEFSPNMGAGSKQFECKMFTFFGHFDARNEFLVQVKPNGKYVEYWIFVDYCSCL